MEKSINLRDCIFHGFECLDEVFERTPDHDHWKTKRTGGLNLGIRCHSSTIFGDYIVDGMITQQL